MRSPRGAWLWLWVAAGATTGCAVASGGPDEPDEPVTAAPLTPLEEACFAPLATFEDGWTGTLTDSHTHTQGRPGEQEVWAIDLLGEMNATGTEHVVVLTGHLDDGSGGLEQSVIRIRGLEEEWIPIMEACPRLRLQVRGFDPEDEASGDYVASMLDRAPFVGVGAMDLRHPMGNHSPTAPGLLAVYPLLAARRLPFSFHGIAPGDGEFVAEIVALAQAWPEIPFLWFGCSPVPERPPNLFCNQGGGGPAGGWAGVPESMAQGWIVGTDTGPLGWVPEEPPDGHYSSFEEAMTEIRRLLGEMEPAVADLVGHGVFDSVFPHPPE